MTRIRLSMVFSLILLVAATRASADTTWTLQGLVFDDGGKASGDFIMDAAGNITSADITTTTGTTVPGTTYDSPGGTAAITGNANTFFEEVFYNATDTQLLVLINPDDIHLLSTGTENLCIKSIAAGCFSGPPTSAFFVSQEFNASGTPRRYLTSGEITSAVPEPATVLLLGSGLAIWGRKIVKRV